MTIQHFNSLSQRDQETVIFEQAEFLHVETSHGFKYAVYAKDKFFIEVVCFADSLKVWEINSFVEGELLNKYSHLLLSK